MQTYRVKATEQGWKLYRARSVRRVMQASSLKELIQVARPVLSRCGALISVSSSPSHFHEIRFEASIECWPRGNSRERRFIFAPQ